jgi:hypothetical protein
MPSKTIYIRDADLPVWGRAQRIFGDKSMSTLFIEMLSEKLKARGGFLHVLSATPDTDPLVGQFAVIFNPVDQDAYGRGKPHFCRGLDELRGFLGELGLGRRAVAKLVDETLKTHSSSELVSLPQDRIDLI